MNLNQPLMEDSHEPEYPAVIKAEGNWWIGWIEEVPGVNCQERTREELMEGLKVTLERPWSLTGRTLYHRQAPIFRKSRSPYEKVCANRVPALQWMRAALGTVNGYGR